MSLESARAYLKNWQRDQDILEFSVSSATVELAAKALNTDPAHIAKTLSFMVNGKPILVVASGDKRIDNRKFKQTFGTKPVMLAPEQVEELIGHQVGGVCPFGVNEGVTIYLDDSLQDYEFIYPACGSAQSAIQLTPDELATIVHAAKWIDVCKAKSEEHHVTAQETANRDSNLRQNS